MENQDNMNTIKIRRCDLNAIFVMSTDNNNSLIKSMWDSVEVFIKNTD